MLDSLNRFSKVASTVNHQRSRFDRSFGHKTSFNSGVLIPIYTDEVLPGDTISLDTSCVCRMSTPIFPVMDNAYLDIYYFFVPMRLVWDHAKEFFGENTTGPWESQAEYTIPQVAIKEVFEGTLFDYFGLPLYSNNSGSESNYPTFNELPFRCYALCWNEYFRDQNFSTPIPIMKGDATLAIKSYATSVLDSGWFNQYSTAVPAVIWNNTHQSGRFPLPVAKFHDYFTSALPEPQKGPAVTLPLANMAPLGLGDEYILNNVASTEIGNIVLNNANADSSTLYPLSTAGGSGSGLVMDLSNPNMIAQAVGVNNTNLYADLTKADAVTINSFRQALALQGLYELDARGGTRYREIIKSHFGVTSADARMQIPEYLFGKRIPITMAQVLQTSATDSTSPQGNTAAYSLTQDTGSNFTYSATEHGYILGLCCVRTAQSYGYRTEKMWLRKRRFDFYWPIFANLGEQPITEREIFTPLQGNPSDDVFGFQEAWADYRYKPNMLTGLMRPGKSLDVWNYAERMTTRPTLSEQFIYQDKDVISRTLAVQNQPQFIADFYFKSTWVRPMPMYSVPALLGRM